MVDVGASKKKTIDVGVTEADGAALARFGGKLA